MNHPWLPPLLRDACALLAAARVGASDPEILWAISTAHDATETALRAFSDIEVQRVARAELEEPRRKFDPEAARRRAAEAI
jgi:hypothetical protein